MNPALPALGLKVAAPAVLAGYRALRHELARQQHDGLPIDLTSIDDVLDEAVSVLARDATTLWGTIHVAAKGMVSRPELFDHPVARSWIATESAQLSLKLAARAAINGEDDAPHAASAIAHYMLFAEEDESAPDAGYAYGVALGFMLLSLRRVFTPGERAVLRAVHSLRDSLSRDAGTAGILLDEHVDRKIERLRARRFFRSANSSSDAATLISAVIDGELRGASPARRAYALAWCARILAFAETDVAQVALAQAAGLGRPDIPELRLAQAFVAAASDYEAGLRLLGNDRSKAAATATFQILRRGLGTPGALSRARDAAIGVDQLDGDGRYSIITALIECGEWDGALDAIRALETEDFEATPALLWVAATALVAVQLPDDLKPGVLQDIPPHPRALPLREDTASRVQRQLALSFMERAAAVCGDLGLTREAMAAERYCLWLRLRDPELRQAAGEELKRRIDLPGKELTYLPLALSFVEGVDRAKAEELVRRQIARGAGDEPEVASAAAALLLKHAHEDPGEAVGYIDRNRTYLTSHLEPEGLVRLEVGVLTAAGRHDAAAALLATAGAGLPPEMRAVLESAVEESEAEPTLEVLEQAYGADPQTALLDHLVRRYRELDYTPRFLEHARRLLADLPTQQSAYECLVYLAEQGRDSEAAELVEILGQLVEQSPPLALQAAWTYFRLGQFDKAEALLDKAPASPDFNQSRALRYQLLIASGKWEAIDAFLEEQWQARDAREPLELAQCALLAAQTRAKRVPDLLREAVARAPDDPYVLVAAYSAATAAGLEETMPEAGVWIARAAEHSSDDGPIQKRPITELLDGREDWEARVTEATRGWARAEMPLLGVAMMLNRPWLELQLEVMLENFDRADSRRRAAPLFSGRKRVDQQETFGAREIAMDRHAVITLAAAGALEAVVAAFDEIYVAHDLLTDLFQQRNRVAFHQPSKIAFAHRLLELLARGKVRAFEPTTLADVGLVTEIGHSRAALLAEAKAHADGQHLVVHPYPITKVGSLLSEPVDLERHAHLLCSCSGVLDALEKAGRLGTAELKRARDYFEQHDKRWPGEPELAPGATLYLTDLAVDYFRYAGVIDKIAAAGFTVIVARSEIEDAEALRDVEASAQSIERVIDDVRACLVPGLPNGTVRLDAAPAQGEGLESYSAALASLVERSGTLVSDDRVINRHSYFDHPEGRRRIFSSLDLIETLATSGRIDDNVAVEARSRLRRFGVTYVGAGSAELIGLTRQVAAEAFRENGELRAIRENLRIAQKRCWFDPHVDIGWLGAWQENIAVAIAAQWNDEVSDEFARACSSWLFNCMQSRDWAQSDVGALDGIAVNGIVLDLLKLVGVCGKVQEGARSRFSSWLKDGVFEPLWASEPRVEAQFERSVRDLLISVATDFRSDNVRVDFRQALLIAIDTLPDFIQVQALADEAFRAHTGHALEATVQIGDANFQRSTFWQAASTVYATPEGTKRVKDLDGRQWTLKTERGDGSWPLLLRRGDKGYRTRGLAGLHPDAAERVAMLDTMLNEYGHLPVVLSDWRERLAAAPLDPGAIEALDTDLRTLPGATAVAIGESLSANEAAISLLVPPARSYWEALVGAGDVADLDAYVAEVAHRQIARLRADYVEADKAVLLLAAHPTILAHGRFGVHSADALRNLGSWALDGADPFSKVGFIEIALPHAAADPELEKLIIALTDEIEALDPDDRAGDLNLLSSLAMFVDGELSRLGVLADWPPFRRRHASFAQAALIFRIVAGQIDTAHFAKFCTNERGSRYFVQNLLDLRREPRWRPDMIGADQLRHEMIGRIINAAGALQPSELTDGLKVRLLGDENSLRARMSCPMAFWPGPLEGGSHLQSLPEPLCDQLDREFGDETPSLEALTLFINSSMMFAVPADLAERVSDRICAAGPRLLALIPADHLYGHLVGLTHAAASHRLEALADAVRLLARIQRHQAGWAIGEEMQLALHTAASREDPGDWRTNLGSWLSELAARAEDREFGESLLCWIETLCEIDPLLRTQTAGAMAMLRLLLDR